MSKPSEIDIGFAAGICVALAVLKHHGSNTLYREVLNSAGRENIIKEARRRGVMRWSGLSEFLREERKP